MANCFGRTVKQTRPTRRAYAGRARAAEVRRSLDDVIIVPLDPNFDIDSESNEPQPVEAAAPAIEAPAAGRPARRSATGAVAQANNLVR